MGNFVFKPGVIASKPDPRDYIYSKVVAASPDGLPSFLFRDRIPIRDQGPFGTCTGQAGAALKDLHARVTDPTYQASPLFIYEEEKKRDGMPNVEGSQPRVTMQVLQQVGACREQTYPYSQLKNVFQLPAPSQSAYDEAKKFEIQAYARLQTVDEIKHAIATQTQGAVLAGVIVCENFVQCEDGGFVDLPVGKILGGHAIVLDGYDDDLTHTYKSGTTRKGFFRFINSWGEGWGDKGYGYMPYDYVTFRTVDIGMPFFLEAWAAVDVLLPPKQSREVVMWVGKQTALVDGKEVQLDQPPVLNNATGRTLVPLRFLSEQLGWVVNWDAGQQKITLRK